MTGHRATVTVDGVTWALHADGSRTATVNGRKLSATRCRHDNEAWEIVEASSGRKLGMVGSTRNLAAGAKWLTGEESAP